MSLWLNSVVNPDSTNLGLLFILGHNLVFLKLVGLVTECGCEMVSEPETEPDI